MRRTHWQTGYHPNAPQLLQHDTNTESNNYKKFRCVINDIRVRFNIIIFIVFGLFFLH